MRHLLLIAASLLLSLMSVANGHRTDSIPTNLVMFNYSDLVAVRDSIQAGGGHYSASYKRLFARANTLLNKVPESVISGDLPPSGDPHDFYAIGKFAWPNPNTPDSLPWIRKDGDHNEQAFGPRYDLTRLQQTTDDVNTLCLAWFFSQDEQYASKAKDLLHTWFIDTASRMNPNMNYASALPGVYDGMAIGIIFTVGFIEMVDHVKLLQSSTSWDTTSDNQLKGWFLDYKAWLDTSAFGIEERGELNNHATWYSAQLAAYSIYTGDSTGTRAIFQRAKTQIGQQLTTAGAMPQELSRVDAFHYSTYGLRAFAVLARALEIQGYDLWNHTSSYNENLLLAYEFLIPYLLGDQIWTYGGTVNFDNWGFVTALIWAHQKFQTPELAEVIQHIRFPVIEDETDMEKLYVFLGKTIVSPFSTGNLLLVCAGDGSASPTGAVPVALQEYTISGTRVQTVMMPAVATGTNKKLTLSSLTSNEGLLTRSADSACVTLVGYDAAPGTTGVGASTATAVNRIVAFTNYNGHTNTAMALNNNFNLQPRSAVTDSGTNVWIGGSSGGVKYVLNNSSTPTVTTLTAGFSPRAVDIYKGQLYASLSNTSPATRLGKVGTGMPTTATQTLTNLPGLPEGTGSPYGFVFFDNDNNGSPDLLYIADETAGLLKYYFNGTAWVARGSVAVTGFSNNALKGLTGAYDSTAGFVLYGTTLSSLLKFVDNALPSATISASPVQLAAAPANRTFKGVAFAPVNNNPLSPRTAAAMRDTAVVTADKTKKELFDVYPVGDQLHFSVYSEKDALVSVSVFDINGNRSQQAIFQLRKGMNRHAINMTGNPTGVYIVVCREKAVVKKFFKP